MSRFNANFFRVISIIMLFGLIAGLVGLTEIRWVLILRMVPGLLMIVFFIVKRKYYFWTIIADVILLGMTIGIFMLLRLTDGFRSSYLLMIPLVLYAIMLFYQQVSGYPIFKDLDK